ncbi:hypothetical protein [Natronomonas sp. EA1]|uniref:hypothetical protein n=1 Tax=Natronomonas sp. EA1 TaxID=3421655 RepID=UPI003EB6C614
MTDTVQCWLVERSYDSRNLVTLVYATPDGERAVTKEISANMLMNNPVTAADDVPERKLTPVDDDLVERYRTEVARVQANNGPDEEI